MKRRLRVFAILSLLCGLAAGGLGGWIYYRVRTQAEAGVSLQRRALQLYDQSDTVKGTLEENRLIEEGQRYEQSGNDMLASAKSNRVWAMIFGVGSIVLLLTSVALIALHLKTKEADLSS
jgi:type II secretory pathway pseudopilin PulG